MKRLMIALAAGTFALPAAPQLGNPGGMSPATLDPGRGQPPGAQMNTQDRLFLHLAADGGRAEVEAGRLALQKGTSDALKAYAQRMVDDHGQANERLARIAAQAGAVPRDRPSPDAAATQARLAQLQGLAFDAAYLQSQLIDHQKTVQLLQWEIGNGQHAAVQRFAAETLPTVLDHLAHVQRLAAAASGTAAPSAALQTAGPHRP